MAGIPRKFSSLVSMVRYFGVCASIVYRVMYIRCLYTKANMESIEGRQTHRAHQFWQVHWNISLSKGTMQRRPL